MWDVTKCTFKTTANKSSRQEKGGSFLVWFSDWLKSSVGRGTWLGHSHHASPRGQLETAGKQPNILINNKQSPVYSNWFATVAQSSKKDFLCDVGSSNFEGSNDRPCPRGGGLFQGRGVALARPSGSALAPILPPPVHRRWPTQGHIFLCVHFPRETLLPTVAGFEGWRTGNPALKKNNFLFS